MWNVYRHRGSCFGSFTLWIKKSKFNPQLFFGFGNICMWQFILGTACRIWQKTWKFRSFSVLYSSNFSEQLLLGLTCSCLLKKEAFPSCYSTDGIAGHWLSVWWDNDPVLGLLGAWGDYTKPCGWALSKGPASLGLRIFSPSLRWASVEFPAKDTADGFSQIR